MKNKMIIVILLVLLAMSLIIVGIKLMDSNECGECNVQIANKPSDTYLCIKKDDDPLEESDRTIKHELKYDNYGSVVKSNMIIDYKYSDIKSYNGMVDFFKKDSENAKYSYNDKDMIITMTDSSDSEIGMWIKNLVDSYINSGYTCNLKNSN